MKSTAETPDLAKNRSLCLKVKEHPFATPIVFGELGGRVIPPGHMLSRMVEFLEKYERETLFKLHDQQTLAMRGALGWHPQTRLPSLEVVKEPKILPGTWEKLGSLYTAYRLIDAYNDFNPLSERNEVRPKKLTVHIIENTIKIPNFWKRLARFPQTLKEARIFVERKMNISPDTLSPITITEDNAHMVALEALARSAVTLNYEGLANNIRVAAMHVAYMARLPGLENDGTILPDIPDDKQKLLNFRHHGSWDDPNRETKDQEVVDFLEDTTPSHLRLGLQLSLEITPICLFWKLALHKLKCDRGQMIEAAQALGNERPRELRELEREILKTVFRIAVSPDSLVSELKSLVATAIWRECESLSENSEAALFFTARIPSESSLPMTLYGDGQKNEQSQDITQEKEKNETEVLNIVGYDDYEEEEEKEQTEAHKAGSDADEEEEDDAGVEMVVDKRVGARDEDEEEEAEKEAHKAVGSDEEEEEGAGDEEEEEEAEKEAHKAVGSDEEEEENEEEGEEGDAGVEMDVDERLGAGDDDEEEEENEEEEEEEENEEEGEEGDDEGSVVAQYGESDDEDADASGKGKGDKEESEEQDDVGRKLRSRNRKDEVKDVGKARIISLSTPRKRKRRTKGQAKSDEQVESSEGEDDAEALVKDYIDVDFWAERLITLEVESTPPRHSMSNFVAYGPTGQTLEFEPVAHHLETMRAVRQILTDVELAYEDGKPLHLSNPKKSAFSVITHAEQQKMDTKEWMKLLQTKHVVITGGPTEGIDFRNALLQLGTPSTVMTVQDLSVPAHVDLNKRIRGGSIGQILQAAEMKGGKMLNALDIGLPGAGLKATKYASNVAALNAMRGGWKSSRAQPMDTVNWALAATEGAFHTFHIDSNGFLTFISVVAGAKLWIIARPREGYEGLARSDVFLTGSFNVSRLDRKRWILEAILLGPGDKLIMNANTLHGAYTPKPTVVHGGHCYATSSLPSTLFGIVHAFMAGNLVTNTNHPPARFHLQEMIDFYHLALVRDGLFVDDARLQHVPNIEDETEYRQLLAICMFGILINVLDFGTYRHPGQSSDSEKRSDQQEKDMIEKDANMLSFEERRGCTYTRGQSLEILEFIETCFKMKESSRKWPDIKTYHEGVIIQQCKMLVTYKLKTDDGKRLSGAAGCSLNLLSAQILGLSTDRKMSNQLDMALHEAIGDIGNVEAESDMSLPKLGRQLVRIKSGRFVSENPTIMTGRSQRDKIYLATMMRLKKEEEEGDAMPLKMDGGQKTTKRRKLL